MGLFCEVESWVLFCVCTLDFFYLASSRYITDFSLVFFLDHIPLSCHRVLFYVCFVSVYIIVCP